MNRDDHHRDQAERLRKRMEKKEDDLSASSLPVSTLPPRSEVHKQKKQKTKWKLRYPIIRILVLFFILLPIVIFSIYTYLSEEKGNKVSNVRDDYESVDFVEDTEIQEQEENEIEIEEQSTGEDSTTNEVENGEKELVGKQSGQENLATEVEGPTSEEMNDEEVSQVQETGEGKDGATSSQGNVVYHKVQPNETLYRIATKYFRSQSGIEIIKKANGLQGNEIQAGQTLKIPLE